MIHLLLQHAAFWRCSPTSSNRNCAFLVSSAMLQGSRLLCRRPLERLTDGTLLLARGSIVVRVTKSFPVEASPDGRPHFCVWDSGWGFEARCVFLPAGA